MICVKSDENQELPRGDWGTPWLLSTLRTLLAAFYLLCVHFFSKVGRYVFMIRRNLSYLSICHFKIMLIQFIFLSLFSANHNHGSRASVQSIRWSLQWMSISCWTVWIYCHQCTRTNSGKLNDEIFEFSPSTDFDSLLPSLINVYFTCSVNLYFAYMQMTGK